MLPPLAAPYLHCPGGKSACDEGAYLTIRRVGTRAHSAIERTSISSQNEIPDSFAHENAGIRFVFADNSETWRPPSSRLNVTRFPNTTASPTPNDGTS